MLKCLVDSEDLKVSFGEKEQLESPEEAGISFMKIAKKHEMREAKNSSRYSGKKRMRCISPVWRGGIHN